MEILISIILALSYTLEGYSVYIRTGYIHNRRAESQSMAGLMQYASRTINMLSVFFMAFYIEAAGIIDASKIFALSTLVGMGLTGLLITSKTFYDILKTITSPLLRLSYNDLSREQCWSKPTHKPLINKKITAGSVFCNLLIILALFFPFIFNEKFSGFPMTLVYTSQMLNFLSTLFLMLFVDPVSMRMIDSHKTSEVRDSMIFGRLISLGVAFLIATPIYFM